MPLKGHPVRVTVETPDKPKNETDLEEKLQNLLLKRRIDFVSLSGDQLIIGLHDGGTLSLNYPGGIKQTD